jgi:hypothetical protein
MVKDLSDVRAQIADLELKIAQLKALVEATHGKVVSDPHNLSTPPEEKSEDVSRCIAAVKVIGGEAGNLRTCAAKITSEVDSLGEAQTILDDRRESVTSRITASGNDGKRIESLEADVGKLASEMKMLKDQVYKQQESQSRSNEQESDRRERTNSSENRNSNTSYNETNSDGDSRGQKDETQNSKSSSNSNSEADPVNKGESNEKKSGWDNTAPSNDTSSSVDESKGVIESKKDSNGSGNHDDAGKVTSEAPKPAKDQEETVDDGQERNQIQN